MNPDTSNLTRTELVDIWEHAPDPSSPVRVNRQRDISYLSYLSENCESVIPAKASSLTREQLTELLLHTTARKGDEDAATKLLIYYGAQVNTSLHNGYNALHYASRQGHCNTLKVLLEHCNTETINQVSTDRAPIHLAMENGHKEAFQLLLAHGARLTGDGMQKKLLNLAAAGGSYDIFLETFNRILSSGAIRHPLLVAGDEFLLHAALKGGNLDIFHFLEGKLSSLSNAQARQYTSAKDPSWPDNLLHTWLNNNKPENSAGIDAIVNTVSLYHGLPGVKELLISPDAFRYIPLRTCLLKVRPKSPEDLCCLRLIEIYQKTLSNEEFINVIYDESNWVGGNNLLHGACQASSPKPLKALLKIVGVSGLHRTNVERETALHIAFSNKNPAIACELIDTITKHCEQSSGSAVTFLTPLLRQQDRFSRNPLNRAAGHFAAATFALVLDKTNRLLPSIVMKELVTSTDMFGCTSIHHLCNIELFHSGDHPHALRTLLPIVEPEHLALKNNAKETALMLLRKSWRNDLETIAIASVAFRHRPPPSATQKAIAELQNAICASINTLLKRAGSNLSKIDRFYFKSLFMKDTQFRCRYTLNHFPHPLESFCQNAIKQRGADKLIAKLPKMIQADLDLVSKERYNQIIHAHQEAVKTGAYQTVP